MSSDDGNGERPVELDAERTAKRALFFLGGARRGQAEARESANGEPLGAPGGNDTAEIAARLLAVGRDRPSGPEALGSDGEIEGLARKIVLEAESATKALARGAAPHSLRPTQVVALEAVIHTRGRPAVRIDGNDLEDMTKYPGAGIWTLIVDNHRRAIMAACNATAAVRVVDRLAGGMAWVQGSAWLVSADTAITNRHVLFPPLGGTRLARRVPGTSSARMRRDLDVCLDFAFHDNPPDPVAYKIVDIPFVSEENDPVDAAMFKVEPVAGKAPLLNLTREPQEELERLYVVGHPGLMPAIPAEVRAVFGNPDEKKRVSFGQVMTPATRPGEDIVHDASTIGGFSGGCVMDFLSNDVAGLHYLGDTAKGNRAVAAAAILNHPGLSRLLPGA